MFIYESLNNNQYWNILPNHNPLHLTITVSDFNFVDILQMLNNKKRNEILKIINKRNIIRISSKNDIEKVAAIVNNFF